MPISKGMSAYRESRAKTDHGVSEGRKLYITEGVPVVLRPFGDFESGDGVVIGQLHYVERLPKGRAYQNCGKNAEEGQHAGCVFCFARDKGDKGVGYGQDRVYFDVKDYSRYHKMEQEVGVLKAGYVRTPGKAPPNDAWIRTKYPPCAGPKKTCEYCQQGNEAKTGGFKYLEMSGKFADVLFSQYAALRCFCRNCGGRDSDTGEGTITVAQYVCGNAECQQPVDFDPEAGGTPVVYCDGCEQTLPPDEQVECSGCDNPERASITDFRFKMTRTGQRQQTQYTFEPIHPVKPPTPEELEEYGKYKTDFVKILTPEAAEQQAATLGIACPFKTAGHGAKGYGQGPNGRPATGAAGPAMGLEKSAGRPAGKPIGKPIVVEDDGSSDADVYD